MPPVPGGVATVIARGGQSAQEMQHGAPSSPSPSVFDVWSHSYDGMAARMDAAARDPVAFLAGDPAQQARVDAAMMPGQWSSVSVDRTVDSVAAQASALGDQVGAVREANGALQTVGATFALLTSVEQMISSVLSIIPFPAFPAVRITDMDVGLPHAHAHPPNLVPPAPPVPLPSTGPVIPIPILSGATQTLINGMPAARCGDMGLAIWCGGYFPMYEIFLGSSSVWIEGARAARVAVDITKHCTFTTPRPQDPPLGPMVGTTISSSPNVMIGGIPMPSLLGMAMGAALGGLGKLIRRGQASKLGQRIAIRTHAAADGLMTALGISSQKWRDRISRAVCFAVGHPVDVATGKVFTACVDFALPGPIPLRWERSWVSTSTYDGPLGHGWHHAYDGAVLADGHAVAIRLGDGRGLAFPALAVGQEAVNPAEGLTLSRDERGYAVRTTQRHTYRFGPVGRLNEEHALLTVTDPSGNRLALHYGRTGALIEIVDSVGRVLSVVSDAAGRIAKLIAPHPSGSGDPVTVVEYAYDQNGDLTSVLDVAGQPRSYTYDHHLLVRETDRNNFSFSFDYDGTDAAARCVRTWGDGGVLDRRLAYCHEPRTTTVTTPDGTATTYVGDDSGLVKQIVDPEGARTVHEFDKDGRPLREVSATGVETTYRYDSAGALLEIVNAGGQRGAAERFQYDARGLMVRRQSTVDGVWTYSYDESGNCIRRMGPGEDKSFEHDTRGRLRASFDRATGERRFFAYDRWSTLNRVRDGEGHTVWEGVSDAWGRLGVERRGQALAVFRRDAGGRIRQMQFGTGETLACSYDAEGYPVEHRDVLGRVHKLTYGCWNRVTATDDAVGNVRRVDYDSNLQPVRLVDAIGAELALDRDGNGRIVRVRRNGTIQRVIRRDGAGRPTAIEKPGVTVHYHRRQQGADVLTTADFVAGRRTQFHSRLISAEGSLLAARNDSGQVEFDYDGAGRCVAERADGREVRREFDARHRLRRLITDLGNVSYEYGRDGLRIIDPLGGTHFVDARGRRKFASGIVEEWEATAPNAVRHRVVANDGRSPLLSMLKQVLPTGERLLDQTHDRRRRRFRYDAAGRLLRVEVDGSGGTSFAYDAEGNLILLPDGRRAHVDADHILRSAGETTYEYDAQGRRTREVSATCGAVDYAYDLPGNLTGWAHDGTTAAYSYDPMNRRILKVVGTRRTHYCWDGPQLLGELADGWSRLYIYADRRDWTPVVFLEQHPDGRAETYAVHGGGQSLPVMVTNEDGQPVWEATFAPYGRAHVGRAASLEFNFRLPGQYEDTESGLHYNRFRHYDPDTGRYLQPDPLFMTNSHRLYTYSTAPLDHYDVLGLAPAVQCGRGGGRRGQTASHRASAEGIEKRKQIARERLQRGEYDPLADTLTRDELDEFLTDGTLPDDVHFHHTVQTSSDPSMADVPEHIQPVRRGDHIHGEHGGDPRQTPTAGIRGDVTSPESPIYDPNAPTEQTRRYEPMAERDADPDALGSATEDRYAKAAETRRFNDELRRMRDEGRITQAEYDRFRGTSGD